MTKLIILIALLATVLACNKGIEFSNGTILQSIEYTDGDEYWTEKFSYNSSGDLILVENLQSYGRDIKFEYTDNRLIQYLTYQRNDNKLIFRDSIGYNSDGSIAKIYNFSINSGDNLPLHMINEFFYDAGKLKEKISYSDTISNYKRTDKFYWEGANIIKVETYNNEEKLIIESWYEYDDNQNFKKNNPYYIENSNNWSANNAISFILKDHVGNICLVCNPCITDYKYNLDGLPVKITAGSGRIMKLNYQ